MIFVCSDIEFGLNYLLTRIDGAEHQIFRAEKEGFSIDEAHEIINAAYLASENEKSLIAIANNFNEQAQNALLKLLEEPPKNIIIHLLAPRKHIFLPTIRSRLSIEYINARKPDIDQIIDFDKFDLKSLYNFIKANSYIDRVRAKILIEEMFNRYIVLNNISVNNRRRFLDAIGRSTALLTTSVAVNALLPIMLILLECEYDSKTKQ
jgi:DNA polymerase-3 subunit delta'